MVEDFFLSSSSSLKSKIQSPQSAIEWEFVLKDEIGKRLRRIRKKRDLTQKELADNIKGKIDYSYIGKIERGEQLPSLKMLLRICSALSIPVEYFFRDEKVIGILEMLPKDLKELIQDEKKQRFLQSLKKLDDEDIPLVTEIIEVLHKHRENRAGQKKVYKKDSKRYPLVADKEDDYKAK